ncbi:MAG: DUF4169 family protein [Pseudomonadota bacterium]
MSTPINLNRYRKQMARAAKRAQADENAARHGRSKAERELEEARARKAKANLAAHRRDETDTPE